MRFSLLSLVIALRNTNHRCRVIAAFGLVLSVSLSGCSSTVSRIKSASPSLPDFSLPKNTASFKQRFYGGVNMGPTTLDPDTGALQTSYTDAQSATGSQIRIGYDIHNMLSLELDSSVLGSATLNQSGSAEVKYSALSTSAVVYGLNSTASRSRRTGWSAFGRLGLAYNRQSSNVSQLDNSGGEFIYGLGAEYGFGSGLALRLEGTQYGPDARFVGLGIVYRVGNIKRYLPVNLVKGKSASDDPTLAAAHAASSTRVYDPLEQRKQQTHLKPVSVRLLASARDLDADGVANEADECKGTEARTTVDQKGCGIFDGTLKGVSFASGSSALNEDSRAVLNDFAMKLQAFPEVRVAIVGHTDNRGPAEINNQVAKSRALSIQRYLGRSGVPDFQMETRAGSVADAVADNNDETQRQRNRRIEIVTLPNLTLEQYRDSQKVATATVSKKSKKVKKSEPEQVQAKVEADATPVPDQLIEPDEPVLGAARAELELLPESIAVSGLDVAGILDGVSFREGTADLTRKSSSLIKQLATDLRQHPAARFVIVAHTNSLSTAQQNYDLTMRQAKAVTRELARQGVSRRRMKALGVGDTLPLIQNLTAKHEKINRRVELRLLGN